MQPFDSLCSVAAALPLANVDTDKIIPARFLKTITRNGLGQHLFHALRYENEQERADFVLNRPAFRDAQILIASENFGCGSSREHAVWALLDFGIRAVIAPSFGDIFQANCFKNGLLPVVLRHEVSVAMIQEAALGSAFRIDLPGQMIVTPGGQSVRFEVDSFRKTRLLNGDDDISLTLKQASRIAEFEARRAAEEWLYPAVEIDAP